MHLDYYDAFNDPQIRRLVASEERLYKRYEMHGVFSALYEFGRQSQQQ